MSLFGFLNKSAGYIPLFNDLCTYHKIDRNGRTLLNNIAQKFSSDNPIKIFLDSDCLQKAVSDPEFTDSVEKINEYLTKWFGE
ncbi:MAG: hypothetical protein LBE18_05945 [Planctomycetaceae bacterium]|jgi:hypothetical protein|nr:hypothetical protein [Planctomycetaceae bacterium]